LRASSITSGRRVTTTCWQSEWDKVAEEVMGGHKPTVWVSDRYAGRQEMAAAHQVCLAHVLRDVPYAIDCGDAAFAPALAKLFAWAIAIGRRRDALELWLKLGDGG
jgi:hypothetical protein